MKKRNHFNVDFRFGLIFVLPLLACQKSDITHSSPAAMTSLSASLSDQPPVDQDLKAFKESFYPLVQKNCAPCHASFINPQFANPDPGQAMEVAKTFKSAWPDYQGLPLVDFDNPESSRIVLRLKRDQHQCWSSCDESADEMVEAIQNWKVGRQEGSPDQPNCQDPSQQLGKRQVRLLSNAEYRHTIEDIFSLEMSSEMSLPSDISKKNLFDHLTQERPVQLSQLKAYLDVAEKIAHQVVESSRFTCPSDQADAAIGCMHQFLDRYGRQLWRRDLQASEKQQLEDLFRKSFESLTQSPSKGSMKELIVAMLLSPNFLYRYELGDLQSDGSYRLSHWEVASSLSYFFWRSLPDQELFDLARQQKLHDPTVIAQQVERLIGHKKAERGIGDFIKLWTRSYRIHEARKEGDGHDKFTASIREKMAKEIVSYAMQVIFNHPEGDYESLMTLDYSIGDEELAAYYGANLDDQGRMLFQNEDRKGLLTQGSLLASYAFPDSPSPIHRGVFVIENVLCRHFPLPPAVMIPANDGSKSNRDRFKDHSRLKECAVCHEQIDGVGFGFENFDQLALYRTWDQGQKVDASGVVSLDGVKHPYVGTGELAQLISQSQEGHQCFTKQVLRFQTGRVESDSADECRNHRMFELFEAHDFQLKSLFMRLFSDPSFLNRNAR